MRLQIQSKITAIGSAALFAHSRVACSATSSISLESILVVPHVVAFFFLTSTYTSYILYRSQLSFFGIARPNHLQQSLSRKQGPSHCIRHYVAMQSNFWRSLSQQEMNTKCGR